MCDNSRKRKMRHDSTLETGRTVKGIFKKGDLDDSLSASGWGLILDDNYRNRRRGRTVRLVEDPLILICEWDACHQDFTEYVPYVNHLKDHLQIDYFLAEEDSPTCRWLDCTYVATSLTDLNQHLCYHGYHAKLMSRGKNVEHRADLPKCTQSERFVIPITPDGYQCEWVYCGEKFETVFDFYEHIRIHIYHNPKGHKEGVINCCWKGCTYVGPFKTQYRLSEHVRMHTKEKLFACPTCRNLFSNKVKFCDHLRRQLPINLQSYLCSQCSKYFPSERLLRDHMRLHINHYKCSMCEMTCPKPSILAKHIRYKHLNEKPYKCSHCNYTCVSKHNLDFHLKKHEPDNQYKCSECDYTCRSSFGLERHHQKVHGKEWSNVYECDNCKKRFIRGGLLTKHLMKVHNYHWPSGHSRFRYKEDQDGIYRLQTVRYETLDVTEEIIKGNIVQPPSEKESLKFDILRRETEDSNSIYTLDVVVSEKDGKESEGESKKVLITIDDIDLKGKVLKSETIQSSEIVCTDLEQIKAADDQILVVGSEPKTRTSKRKRKRRSEVSLLTI